MTTVSHQLPQTLIESSPPRRRWSIDEFHRMADEGLFQDQRVELLEGEVVLMSPMGAAHRNALIRLSEQLRKVLPSGFLVVTQIPIVIEQRSELYPDVMVLEKEIGDLDASPITQCSLVVEIADTSLAYDLGKKAQLYAGAGVPEYWVLDLSGRRLIVHRQPKNTATEEPVSYKSIVTLRGEEEVAPLCAGRIPIRVLDMMPN